MRCTAVTAADKDEKRCFEKAEAHEDVVEEEETRSPPADNFGQIAWNIETKEAT